MKKVLLSLIVYPFTLRCIVHLYVLCHSFIGGGVISCDSQFTFPGKVNLLNGVFSHKKRIALTRSEIFTGCKLFSLR